MGVVQVRSWAATGRDRACLGFEPRISQRRGLEPVMRVFGVDEPLHVVRFVVRAA
jgi:hypothetical protein